MRRNVLAELRLLKDKIIDVGYYLNTSGEKEYYTERTRRLFMRLSDFVRHGVFLSSKTQKFVAQYYDLAQSELPSYWEYIYPNEPNKAESTFRTQCQNVNRILSALLPDGIVDMFVNQEEEKLLSLEETLGVLDFNDIHIEQCINSSVIEELAKIPSSYEKYEVSDCVKELKLLADMSQDVLKKRISECDPKKLSYAFNVLRKPNFYKGEPCDSKISFLKGYLRFVELAERNESTEGGKPTTEILNSEVTKSNVSKATLDSNTGSDSCKGSTVLETGILNAMKEYIGDVSFTEDTLINPDILSVISSATREHFINSLKSFPKDEVAYIVEQFETGNDLVIDLYKRIISEGGNDLVGDYKFLPTIVQKIENLSTDCEPSAKASPRVAQVLSDYLLDTAMERLELLDKNELARGYMDLREGGTTARLIDKFTGIDTDSEESERLRIKKEIM